MTVQVKALSNFQHGAVAVSKGDTLNVPASEARELEAAGLASRGGEEEASAPAEAQDTQPQAKMADEPKNKAAASAETKKAK